MAFLSLAACGGGKATANDVATEPGQAAPNADATSPIAMQGRLPTDTQTGSEMQSTPAFVASSPWCQALSVVQTNCQGCHGTEQKFGAPMPLVDYADFQAPAVSNGTQTVRERVASRIHDAQHPMPPSGMSVADTATLDAWLQSGAQVGADATCAGLVATQPSATTPDATVWPEDCEEFYTLTTSSRSNPADKYSVAPGTEEHPQFTFDAPWGDADVQILAYRPVTDNAKILHHWILYENASGGVFGGAGGGKFLVGWAPGSTGNPMPDGVGLYMPGGKQSLRLDVHYYNLSSAVAESDASGLEMCITHTLRPQTATVIGLTGNATAPVGRSDNTTSCTAAVTGAVPVHFLSVSPHMHKLGVHAKLELTRSGVTTTLHDEPFEFLDQRIWDLGDLTIQNGDILRTTCSYENDTGSTVRFGQSSNDEMCFNFVTYYPMGALRCGFAL